MNDHGYESCKGHEMEVLLQTVSDVVIVTIDGEIEFSGDTNKVEALLKGLELVGYGEYFGFSIRETSKHSHEVIKSTNTQPKEEEWIH